MQELIRHIEQRANADPVLAHLGRYCSTEFMLEIGARTAQLGVEAGRVTGVFFGPLHMRAWSFAIRAPAPAWQRFWQPVPEAGFHDIFALSRFGHARIEGDVGPLLAHLRFVKALLALPRERPDLVARLDAQADR